MRQGYITGVDFKTGEFLIEDGFHTYKHERTPEAAVGLKVFFKLEFDDDLKPYATGAMVLAENSTNVILQKLNQLQADIVQIQADLNRLLDFEIPENESA